MNKKMNQNLGNTGGNLDREGVRSNIDKKGDQTGGTDFDRDKKLNKRGVDSDIKR